LRIWKGNRKELKEKTEGVGGQRERDKIGIRNRRIFCF
jgi:hypothetical protein